MKRLVLVCSVIAVLGPSLNGCKKDEGLTGVQTQQTGQRLTAVPTSVSVGVGGSQDVSISNGTPPYDVAAPPGSISSAQLLDRDSLVAIVRITGVTAASVATSVTIRDNSAPQAKAVAIPISVH